jgi:hypothetical protein
MNGKKINKFIFITVIFVMGILHTNQNVMGQNWVLVGENKHGKCYIDLTSIEKESLTKRMWLKMITSPEEMIKIRDESKLSTIGYSSYSYSVYNFEFNCFEKFLIHLSGKDFDNSGNVLSIDSPDDSKIFIPPGTLFDRVFKAVCP